MVGKRGRVCAARAPSALLVKAPQDGRTRCDLVSVDLVPLDLAALWRQNMAEGAKLQLEGCCGPANGLDCLAAVLLHLTQHHATPQPAHGPAYGQPHLPVRRLRALWKLPLDPKPHTTILNRCLCLRLRSRFDRWLRCCPSFSSLSLFAAVAVAAADAAS